MVFSAQRDLCTNSHRYGCVSQTTQSLKVMLKDPSAKPPYSRSHPIDFGAATSVLCVQPVALKPVQRATAAFSWLKHPELNENHQEIGLEKKKENCKAMKRDCLKRPGFGIPRVEDLVGRCLFVCYKVAMNKTNIQFINNRKFEQKLKNWALIRGGW